MKYLHTFLAVGIAKAQQECVDLGRHVFEAKMDEVRLASKPSGATTAQDVFAKMKLLKFDHQLSGTLGNASPSLLKSEVQRVSDLILDAFIPGASGPRSKKVGEAVNTIFDNSILSLGLSGFFEMALWRAVKNITHDDE